MKKIILFVVLSFFHLTSVAGETTLSWNKVLSGHVAGKKSAALGYPDLPDDLICHHGANTYFVSIYAKNGLYIYYYALNDSVGALYNIDTGKLQNVGYCGNLIGLTMDQVIEAGYSL